MAFYGFPAAHWQSIRTTNPIESDVRDDSAPRQVLEGLPEPPADAVHAVQAWHLRWRLLSGFRKLGKVVEGMQFKDGIEAEHLNDQMAA